MDMRGHNSRISGNWIAVSRDMRKHPIVGMGQPVPAADPKRGSYSRYEAWQDLLMEAKYLPFKTSNKGKIVLLERGQLMASRAWLAERWNWSEKTVRLFLDRLEKDFMLRRERGQQKGNTVNIVTICNYDIYQTVSELMALTEGQPGASEGPPKGQQGASQGPESNKETKETRKQGFDMGPAVTIDAAAEANGTALFDKLTEAAGPALRNPAATPGLLIVAEPRRWLAAGCDLELDILPTLRAMSRTLRPASVGTWAYFAQAVSDTRATRLRPIPEGRAAPKAKSFAEQDAERHRELMRFLED